MVWMRIKKLFTKKPGTGYKTVSALDFPHLTSYGWWWTEHYTSKGVVILSEPFTICKMPYLLHFKITKTFKKESLPFFKSGVEPSSVSKDGKENSPLCGKLISQWVKLRQQLNALWLYLLEGGRKNSCKFYLRKLLSVLLSATSYFALPIFYVVSH